MAGRKIEPDHFIRCNIGRQYPSLAVARREELSLRFGLRADAQTESSQTKSCLPHSVIKLQIAPKNDIGLIDLSTWFSNVGVLQLCIQGSVATTGFFLNLVRQSRMCHSVSCARQVISHPWRS